MSYVILVLLHFLLSFKKQEGWSSIGVHILQQIVTKK
jgi:hypothetical protein